MQKKPLPAVMVGDSFLLFYVCTRVTLAWNEWFTAGPSTHK